MIKEINFGTAIKLGKTLELSYHNIRGSRWDVTLKDGVFTFKDTQNEFPVTRTTISNVKYWIETEDLELKSKKVKE